ncbi:MAG: hypothetical protein Q9159_003821 [Coniocarpon cinnabarinum]
MADSYKTPSLPLVGSKSSSFYESTARKAVDNSLARPGQRRKVARVCGTTTSLRSRRVKRSTIFMQAADVQAGGLQLLDCLRGPSGGGSVCMASRSMAENDAITQEDLRLAYANLPFVWHRQLAGFGCTVQSRLSFVNAASVSNGRFLIGLNFFIIPLVQLPRRNRHQNSSFTLSAMHRGPYIPPILSLDPFISAYLHPLSIRSSPASHPTQPVAAGVKATQNLRPENLSSGV